MIREVDVHAKLRALAQELWNSYHVCLKDVNFSWIDTRTATETNMTVAEVEATTLTVEP